MSLTSSERISAAGSRGSILAAAALRVAVSGVGISCLLLGIELNSLVVQGIHNHLQLGL